MVSVLRAEAAEAQAGVNSSAGDRDTSYLGS